MFQQGQFLIDPNATPDEIKRKREALDKVRRAYGRANNIGEGVGDLLMGAGQGIQNWRVGKAERAQTGSAENAFANLFSGGQDSSPSIDGGGFPSAPSGLSGTLPEQASDGASPTSESALPGSFLAALDKHEGGGAYDTLFGFSQKNGPFAGTDVSKMTIGQAIGFANPSGQYANYVKGKVGRVATPMGRHQIVGTTLKNAAAEMGLSPDTPFDRTTQDNIALHLARKRVRGSGDLNSKMAGLRSEWAGFKNVPDSQLAQIVTELQGAGSGRQLSGSPQTAAQAVNAMAGQPSPRQAPILDPEAYNAQTLRQSQDLAGQLEPGRMPAPGQTPMAQGRSGLAAALMQQQAQPPAQQAIQQQIPQQAPEEVDPRAQFNSPQLNAADPTKGILAALMARGGQPVGPQNPQNPQTAPQMPMQGQQATPQPQQAQQAPQQAQSAGMDGTSLDLNKAIELMNNPYLDAGKKKVLGVMIERQMAAQDPGNQLDMEYKKAQLDQLRNPQPKAQPAGIQEYEYAKGQGFPGTFQDWEASKKGGMSLQVDPTTGAVTFQQGANMKPLTESQSKDTVYATRAAGSLPTLDKFGEALTSPLNRAADMDPTGLIRGQQSPEYQQARQAGDEFLQAILRKDTGAAITEGEMNSYGRTYLPAPGDGAEVLEQKKIARTRALEAMKAGMPPQAILQQEKALEKTTPQPSMSITAPDAEGWSEISPGVRIRRMD